jgi:hypothetical protein
MAGTRALSSVSRGVTLRRLRQTGAIRAFQIPSRSRGAKMVWRYRCVDLYDFVKTNCKYIVDHPSVGVSPQDIRIQKWRGRLKGYDPESVREYLLRTSRKGLVAEIRRDLRSEHLRLRQEAPRLRRLLEDQRAEYSKKDSRPAAE